MKVADAVDHMTALYLWRIIDSFTKDFPKPEASRTREIILQNVDELTDAGRIDRKLMDSILPYSTRILRHDVLAAPPDEAE